MQSGTIKHWNQDKGYGFIDVDEQSEDVFFISVRLDYQRLLASVNAFILIASVMIKTSYERPKSRLLFLAYSPIPCQMLDYRLLLLPQTIAIADHTLNDT